MYLSDSRILQYSGEEYKIIKTLMATPADAPTKLSPLCERLVNQMLLSHQRGSELLTLTRALAQYSAEKQTLSDKISSVQQQLDKVESVKEVLFSTFEASRQAYQRVLEDDDAKRKILSAELQTRIASVNEYAERVTQQHAKLIHEQASLKEQIELLKQHRASGGGKFDELVQAQQREAVALQERLAKEREREPILVEAVAEAQKLSAVVQAEQAEWKAKVEAFISKFNDVQQKLVDAKQSFDAAKTERDKMSRKVALLEADRMQAISRAEVARDARNVQLAKVQEVTQRTTTLENQIKKLSDLLAMLTGAPVPSAATEKTEHTQQEVPPPAESSSA